MRFFLGQHLGGGFGVGVSVGTGGRAKADSNAVGCLFAIILLVSMLLGALTGDVVGFLVFLAVGFVAGIVASVKLMNKEELDAELAKLAKQIEKHRLMIGEGKTLVTRERNCAKAITLIKEVQEKKLDPERARVIAETLVGYSVLQRILPICDWMEKAERAEFKGQKKRALDFCLDALLEWKRGNVSDEDCTSAGCTDEDTGEVLSRDLIERKARSLGWNG